MIAFSSLWIYRYYTEQCEAVVENIEYYQLETTVKEQFLSSHTYELISSLLLHEYWVDDIYQSINREPLIITSSYHHDDALDLTLVGTSQSFLSWYNMVQQKIKYCHIQIISIDTYKYDVAEAAIKAGANIINDIWGLHYDPDMAAIAAKYKVPVIIMHNSNDTNYGDIIEDMKAYFFYAVDKALKVGITPQQIWLDPGIGFGKTEEQNIEVMQRLGELTAYEYPILLAPSRKRFIGSMLGGLPPEERDEGTVAACITGVFQGVDMVRVHNVKMHKRALAVADGLLRGE